MFPPFHRQLVSVTPPGAIVDNAAYTTAEIDSVDSTLGKAAFLTFVVYLGATDIALAAFKVTESDTSGSGHADVSGADFSVSPATLAGATDDNKFFLVTIDLRNAARKRYFDLTLTAGDGTLGTYACAWAERWYLTKSPTSASELGVSQYLAV